MKKSKGFTLIELMIIVSIIGILSAIAIPKFALLIENGNRKDMGLPSLTMKEFNNKKETGTYVYKNYDTYLVKDFCILKNIDSGKRIEESSYLQKEFENFCRNKGINCEQSYY